MNLIVADQRQNDEFGHHFNGLFSKPLQTAIHFSCNEEVKKVLIDYGADLNGFPVIL